jgi:hypothetical protein
MPFTLRARLAAAAVCTALLGACSADHAVAPASLDRPMVEVASPAGPATPRALTTRRGLAAPAAEPSHAAVRALRSGYLLSTGRAKDDDDRQ